ncbi:hypothetical protein DFR86_11130 [Acidianus sulfidivorans JP7]|uniref:Uncharacterized protein n=1 Tax=Acidianus sulfidivorans JP7 TaxID=619593 RepID=A0A2U9IPU4_9CREN|nr:hypothetical protein [Acidianus sulfidivorans]AWR98032.1 hypothetical protein DFR86_11130 [Acidianus sulfidivorans JP7]
MCLLIEYNVSRPIISNDILLIKKDDFLKLNELSLSVLASDKRNKEISKSYYYFIVNKLRNLGLLIDNAISFRMALPFTVDLHGISIDRGIIFITDDNKNLIYYNPENSTYYCNGCPVESGCVQDLKSIAKEIGIKIRKESLDEAWIALLEETRMKFLSNINYIRAKVNLSNINAISQEKEEEVEKEYERSI